MLLHDRQELDDDFRRRADQDLATASLLGIVDGVKCIVQNTGADHGGRVMLVIWSRFSNPNRLSQKNEGEMRYLLAPHAARVSPAVFREPKECPVPSNGVQNSTRVRAESAGVLQPVCRLEEAYHGHHLHDNGTVIALPRLADGL